MAIGSIPDLTTFSIHNKSAAFILSVIQIDTDRTENIGLFFQQSQSFVYFFAHLSQGFIDEFMVCIGICGSLLSCEAHVIFHIKHLASTSMIKTFKYDPRVCILSIPVHLRGMIKRVFVPVGKGLKLNFLSIYPALRYCSQF